MLKEARGFSQQLGLQGGSVTPMRINSFFLTDIFEIVLQQLLYVVNCFQRLGKFSDKFSKYINNGNRAEWSPIRTVIIQVIYKIRGSPIC